MRVKTSELEGAALDWAVGVAINCKPIMTEIYGVHILGRSIMREVEEGRICPSSNWSQGGPLIAHYAMKFMGHQDGFVAICSASESALWATSHLVAAMRTIAAAELGDEVDVPEELCSE
ncbi:DUF2591 domain-containing protein [Halomonas sp. H10-59]|uniref:DUF2591 domain-containing protein n=1 Tax=Halomonas sp. H10-59 TaxID=2950874 RepID=A0AAU7KPI8_9GAMM